MNLHIEVDDEQFEYLRIQKGSLDQFSDDREQWQWRYEADIASTYDAIAPFLPERCWGFLDIGSGLGGIDVLIRRHYVAKYGEQMGPFVHLLDGVDDKPVVTLHRTTFNDMRVAKDFQRANGLPPERFGMFPAGSNIYPRPYDLVVSFGSWCFHYEPGVYLKQLLKAGGLHDESVLIVDVRATKPEWVAELDASLRRVAVIASRPKWLRCVYVRK